MKPSLNYLNASIQQQLQRLNKNTRKKGRNFLQIDQYMKETQGSRMTIGTTDIDYFKPSTNQIQIQQNYNIKIVDTQNMNMFNPDKSNQRNCEIQKLILRNKQLQLIVTHQKEMLKELQQYTSSVFL